MDFLGHFSFFGPMGCFFVLGVGRVGGVVFLFLGGCFFVFGGCFFVFLGFFWFFLFLTFLFVSFCFFCFFWPRNFIAPKCMKIKNYVPFENIKLTQEPNVPVSTKCTIPVVKYCNTEKPLESSQFSLQHAEF